MQINYDDLIKKNNLPSAGSRIVVAMSGGVDSSVTAALLHNAGYEVIGVTMKLYESKAKKNPKSCCAGIDISDARNVCKNLGIKHHIIDYESRFKESVIDDFVDSYMNGMTPIPCIKCNQTVKFLDLIEFTKLIGCEVLATGHYVKRVENGEDINLYQADDDLKDQSYFLFATTQEQLKFLRFPLGCFSKNYIRKLAENFGLVNADKPDSQDICFIPDGNYRDFIKNRLSESSKRGDIESFDGHIIGQHNGIVDYTIGQRRGIGVGGIKGKKDNEPMYVVDIDKKRNKIIVGPKSKLMKYLIYLKDLNFFSNNTLQNEFDALIKIRSGKRLISAKIEVDNKDKKTGVVQLSEPEFGVAPGQACVFYDNFKKMIGGGWITSSKLE
ncbi:MAG: tRNA 2-thiouridine(34) synthase MnmA [Rickettsiales bacterium]|nr:tRNA 2-thiouridine(34) synthase MnmA [Rickettsiales bacterium]